MIKPIHIAFALGTIFLLISCKDTVSSHNVDYDISQLNDTISIIYNDTISVRDENILLSFESVFAESRCPIGVNCIWAGNATVGLKLIQDKSESGFNLNTNPFFTTDTILSNYKFELIDLLPYPHIDSTYQYYDYSVKLIITN